MCSLPNRRDKGMQMITEFPKYLLLYWRAEKPTQILPNLYDYYRLPLNMVILNIRILNIHIIFIVII